MQINLRGPFLFCREALKIMTKNRTGKIINIVSQAGRTGGIKSGMDYAASKAGPICLTKSMAKYAAPYSVNINSVSPGLIDTDMLRNREDLYSPKMIPLGRYGTSNEVAEIVLFLASEMSEYITGACIDVNGGWFMP